MRNIEGNYVKGLTHATGVTGDAVLTGDTFKRQLHAAAASARWSPRNGTRPDPQPASARHGRPVRRACRRRHARRDDADRHEAAELSHPVRHRSQDHGGHGQRRPDVQGADAGRPAGGRCRHLGEGAWSSDFAVTLGGKTRLTDGAVNFRNRQQPSAPDRAVSTWPTRGSMWTGPRISRPSDPVTTKLAVKGR